MVEKTGGAGRCVFGVPTPYKAIKENLLSKKRAVGERALRPPGEHAQAAGAATAALLEFTAGQGPRDAWEGEISRVNNAFQAKLSARCQQSTAPHLLNPPRRS